jgi:hypothetical protein
MRPSSLVFQPGRAPLKIAGLLAEPVVEKKHIDILRLACLVLASLVEVDAMPLALLLQPPGVLTFFCLAP